MATVLADVANNAGVKIGGFGDQVDGDGQVTTAQLTANDDRISKAINVKYPIVRKDIYTDFAARGCPFKEIQRFASLGPDLKQDDVSISSITVAAGTFQITVVTNAVHNLTTGDTRYLFDILGELKTSVADVDSLNTQTVTVTVVDTITFTINTLVGTAAWDHTENTGFISKVPNIGPYLFAFELPSDYHAIVRQTLEGWSLKSGTRREYQCDTVLNRDGDGFILVTSDKTNKNGDSAYIEYVFDQTTFAMFSPELEECLAMKLGAELAPMVGRNYEFRVAMLVEYRELTIPEALRKIHSRENNSSKVVNDFSGGRSAGGIVPGFRSDLGTYLKADGTRAKINP